MLCLLVFAQFRTENRPFLELLKERGGVRLAAPTQAGPKGGSRFGASVRGMLARQTAFPDPGGLAPAEGIETNAGQFAGRRVFFPGRPRTGIPAL